MFDQLTPRRREALASCEPRLIAKAKRALVERKLKWDQFVIVCIMVDTHWKPIVDAIMPDADWQKWRDAGQEPVAIGIMSRNICDLVAQDLPDIRQHLIDPPAPGNAQVLFMDEDGCVVLEVSSTTPHEYAV